MKTHAFDDVAAAGSGFPSPRLVPEPPAELVEVVSFVVKHSKAKIAISIDGEGLHIMEKGENKTMLFPLRTLKTWEISGKKKHSITIGLIDSTTLVFETKEAETVSQKVSQAVMARLAWIELQAASMDGGQAEPEPEPAEEGVPPAAASCAKPPWAEQKTGAAGAAAGTGPMYSDDV